MSAKTPSRPRQPKKKTGPAPKKGSKRPITRSIRGKGDYKSSPSGPSSDWGKWASRTGSLGGDLLSHIFGRGDYGIRYNTLMDAGGPPQFSNRRKDRSCIITHREYLGDVLSTTTFTNTVYPISIFNQSLFPWLFVEGTQWEQWRLHGGVVEFKSLAIDSINSTNQASGSVIIATQYDAHESPFVNKLQMDNHEFTTSSKPQVSFLHGWECDPQKSGPTLLQTGSSTAAGTPRDVSTYTFGILNVATTGMPAAGNPIGELWISYEVELFKPIEATPAVTTTVELFNSGVTSAHFFQGGTTSFLNFSLPVSTIADAQISPFGSYSISGDTITFTDPKLAGRGVYITMTAAATTVSAAPTLASVTNGTIGAQTITEASASGGITRTSASLNNNAGPWSFTVTGPTCTGTLYTTFGISIVY